MKKLGIYQIKNIITNDIYIGSCSNYNVRKGSHLCILRQNKHHSVILQRAFNKYKEENFVFKLIEELPDNTKLIEREQYYIDLLKPKYNICPTAGSNLNRIFTDVHKQNLSKSLNGKVRTQEQKEYQSKIKLGKTHTIETKNKVSNIVNTLKGSRICDKINSEQILKFIEIANMDSKVKTIKQICKENDFNYRSILKFVSNNTWKEYFNLLLEETISNFKNPSLTKNKQYGL